MSRLESMKQSLRSLGPSTWFSISSTISAVYSILRFKALPLKTSKSRTCFRFEVSRRAITSRERETHLEERNSTRKPEYLGYERILPS